MGETTETSMEQFEFKHCVSLLKSTGRKAASLAELRDAMETVSEESIFHHIYRYFLKRQTVEYSNAFAEWAGESMEERALSEFFSSLDPFIISDIKELRAALLQIIDEHLAQFTEHRRVLPGNEFHFNESVMLIFAPGMKVHNLAEFLIAVKYIDAPSIYYHFCEARVRLGTGADDFSKWIEEALGKKDLAAKIRSIDPLLHTLDGIRDKITALVEEEARKDMEVVF